MRTSRAGRLKPSASSNGPEASTAAARRRDGMPRIGSGRTSETRPSARRARPA
jgi:hypothetical protein